jgi:protein-tyrosine phosphatase
VNLHGAEHPKLDFSQITDTILIGTNACCSTHFDERLVGIGVRADISLEEERLDAPKGAIVFLWLPTADHTPPTPMQLRIGVAALRELAHEKMTVYVHCRQGHGRAPTLIAAYFIAEGMDVAEAVRLVKKKRPITHLRPNQLAALRKFAAEVKKRGI